MAGQDPLRRIDVELSCPGCGSSLLGADPRGSCPRCHRHIASFFRLADIAQSDRTIAEDVLCATCSYNLRGQRIDSDCSECGAPVIASIRMYGIETLTGALARRLGIGVNLLLAGSLILPSAILVTMVIAHVRSIEGDQGLVFAIPLLVAGLATFLFLAVGGFVVTTVPVATTDEATLIIARFLVRLCFVALILGVLLVLSSEFGPLVDRWSNPDLWLTVTTLTVVSLAGALACLILFLRGFLPRRRRWTRRLMMLVSLMTLACGVISTISHLMRLAQHVSPAPERITRIALLLICLTYPLALVSVIIFRRAVSAHLKISTTEIAA